VNNNGLVVQTPDTANFVANYQSSAAIVNSAPVIAKSSGDTIYTTNRAPVVPFDIEAKKILFALIPLCYWKYALLSIYATLSNASLLDIICLK
jgi:hypothetical protein